MKRIWTVLLSHLVLVGFNEGTRYSVLTKRGIIIFNSGTIVVTLIVITNSTPNYNRKKVQLYVTVRSTFKKANDVLTTCWHKI